MGQKASKSVAEEVDKSKEQIEADYNVFKKAEGFQCRNYDADINMKVLNVFILIFILFCLIIYIYLLFRSRKK